MKKLSFFLIQIYDHKCARAMFFSYKRLKAVKSRQIND